MRTQTYRHIDTPTDTHKHKTLSASDIDTHKHKTLSALVATVMDNSAAPCAFLMSGSPILVLNAWLFTSSPFL
jgi:hypothetical protein